MRTTVAFVLASTATIALTGCGTGTAATGSSSTSSVTSTATAASTTVASSTAATTSTSTPTSAPTPGSVVPSSELSADLVRALAGVKSFQVVTNMMDSTATVAVSEMSQRRTDFSIKDTDGMEMRAVDQVMYLRMGARGRKPWVKLDLAAVAGGSQAELTTGLSAMGAMSSAQTEAAVIAKGKKTTFVGTEQGQRHYRTVVAGNVFTDVMSQQVFAMVKLPSAEKSSMSSEMSSDSAKYAKATMYVDTWVAADGRPTRFSLDGTELAKYDAESDSGPDVITLRYSKWNAVPAIVAPPASQVGTMPDMGDSATRSGSAAPSAAR